MHAIRPQGSRMFRPDPQTDPHSDPQTDLQIAARAAPMMPADRLGALAGRWRTLRTLRHADGTRARFTGETIWQPDGALLRCTEAGMLEQGRQAFPARRETLWRATPSAIEVLFDDGRPFHSIEGRRAIHDCAPDIYVLDYDFDGWPDWSVRWQVTGPRKSYRATTRYAPIR